MITALSPHLKILSISNAYHYNIGLHIVIYRSLLLLLPSLQRLIKLEKY